MPERKLKRDEEWALRVLDFKLKEDVGDDYKITIPKNEPPDCIVISEKNKKHVALEFTALGSTELFHFFAAKIDSTKPFFIFLEIPYEPEQWISSAIRRKLKKFKPNDNQTILIVHFHGGWKYREHADEAFQKGSKLHQYPIFKVTEDTLHRIRWAYMNSEMRDREAYLVYPGQDPYLLNVKVEKPRQIDIRDGYPTISKMIMNVPINEEINFLELKYIPLKVQPINCLWHKKAPNILDTSLNGWKMIGERTNGGEFSDDERPLALMFGDSRLNLKLW